MKITETKQYTFALDLLKQLKSNDYEAYFVGGCVRDWILGEEPKDIDIATNAHPQQIKDVFLDKGYTVLEVGEKFGVIVIVSDGIQIEIATYRKDGTYSDGRTPDSVEFSTIEEDAKRRDFTMNGLYYDPTTEKIIDLVGGVEDINNKLIRTIGNADDRFGEDYLRMLRAMRFMSQKRGFQIDDDIYKSIHKLAPNIRKISMERIKSEMDKIMVLTSNGDYTSYLLLNHFGLFYYIYGDMSKYMNNLPYRNSVFDRYKDGTDPLVVGYTSLFLDLEDPSIVDYKYLNNLKFDVATSKSILWLVKSVLKFRNNFELLRDPLYKFGSVKSMEYIENPNFDNLFYILVILEQYDKFKNGSKSRRSAKAEHNKLRKNKELWKQIQKFTIVNGNDMLELGYTGSQIKDILLQCKSMYILENKSREELLEFASRNSPRQVS